MHFFLIENHFILFENLLKTLDYFEKKEEYQEKGIQITRAFHKYIKEKYNNYRLPLINQNDMIDIIND